MSAYTPVMVEKMVAHGAWSYADAVAFAQEHNLSVRSVVSKVKSLQLAYEPKPKAARKNPDYVRKADRVAELAEKLGADKEKLSGLAKADNGALDELFKALA